MRTEKNFVVFEGIDASGKGSQIELLKQYVEEQGIAENYLFTFEHTRQGAWSEQIEKIISGKDPMPEPEKFQLLYILDRKDHLANVILPALKKGKVVFCDRYILSTLVYGSYEGSVHWKTLLHYHKDILGDDFILPQKTLLYDVDGDVALGRIKRNRTSTTYFETRDRLTKIRDTYLGIAKHMEGINVVDGKGSVEEVFEKTRAALAEYL